MAHEFEKVARQALSNNNHDQRKHAGEPTEDRTAIAGRQKE